MQGTAVSKEQEVISKLEAATGMEWLPPPFYPSFLENGYHTYVSSIQAPLLVKMLRDKATRMIGRPCHIIFKDAGGGRSVVNIPRDVAEHPKFKSGLDGLHFGPMTIPSSRAGVFAHPYS